MPAETRVARRKGRDVTHDPDLYQRAWEIYRSAPFERELHRSLGIARSTAKTFIEIGVPELGLPPLRTKLQATLRLATQLDVEEGARSQAIGKTAIRRLLVKYSQAVERLDINQIPKALIVPQLIQLVSANEKLTAAERGEHVADYTDSDITNMLSQLLSTVASQRLPGGQKILDDRVVVEMSEDGAVARVIGTTEVTDGSSGAGP